jgi:hypothetical protein
MMNYFRVLEDFTHEIKLPKLPENAEIYNAARPFPAHQTWTGEFLHGIFFGAIFPDADYASEYRQRATDLDASRIIFVTRDEVTAWAIAHCEELGIDLTDFGYDICCRSYLNHYKGE